MVLSLLLSVPELLADSDSLFPCPTLLSLSSFLGVSFPCLFLGLLSLHRVWLRGVRSTLGLDLPGSWGSPMLSEEGKKGSEGCWGSEEDKLGCDPEILEEVEGEHGAEEELLKGGEEREEDEGTAGAVGLGDKAEETEDAGADSGDGTEDEEDSAGSGEESVEPGVDTNTNSERGETEIKEETKGEAKVKGDSKVLAVETSGQGEEAEEDEEGGSRDGEAGDIKETEGAAPGWNGSCKLAFISSLSQVLRRP